MKTVLFCACTSNVTGGVAVRQARLASVLPARGWRPVFGLTWGRRFHDPFAFRVAYPDLETVFLDGRTGTRDGRLRAIAGAIRRTGATVIVPSGVVDAFEVARVLKADGKDVRLLSGLYELFSSIISDIRHYAPLIDQGFGVSRATVQVLREVCGLPAERTQYVPTGVPPAIRTSARLPDEPFRLGLIGRFSPEKRTLDVVDLCRELDVRRLNYRVTVVGEGLLHDALASAARPWVNGGRMTILPPISTKELYERVYPSLDVALLFSAAEGMPNVLMEAMAHEVVPVTADFRGRGLQGFLRHQENSLVFPVGDLRQAAECIKLLWSDPSLREQMARAARAEVASGHTLEIMASAFAAVLDKTVEGPLRRGELASRPSETAGRLSRWLGPARAEFLRRTFRRRFPHPDGNEWPFCTQWPLSVLRQLDDAIERAAMQPSFPA